MIEKKYIDNAIKQLKGYLDRRIKEIVVSDGISGTRLDLPKSGDYTLKSYGLPIITKKSEHFEPSDGIGYRVQGSTVTGDNKILLAWAYDKSGVKVLLEERYISSGKLIRSKELSLGYANCLSYDKRRGVVYCCKYIMKNGTTSEFTHDVTILSYKDLTITNSIDIRKYSAIDNVGVAGCCYDGIKDRLVISTCNSSSESDRKREVIVLEASSKTMITRYNLFPANTHDDIGSATFQGIQMAHNGYCYTVDATYKTIQVLDYMKKTAAAVININDWDDMWRPVLEMEALAPKDPTNPQSDIMVFHGGVVTSGAWYTNSMCGWINPFYGKKYRHRHAYLQKFADGTNNNVGVVDPDVDAGYFIQNGVTVPYVDPNIMLTMLSRKPSRILWNDITFKSGKYGLIRSSHLEARIDCESGVDISGMHLHYSDVHLKGANVSALTGYSSKIWMDQCSCESGKMYSSELKVIGGSGKYYGNGSSFGSKHANSSASLDSKFIS